MSEWQKIETCPRDGSEFLAYDERVGKMDVAYAVSTKMKGGEFLRVYPVQMDGEMGPNEDEFGYAWDTITHWMPLPPAPHSPEKEE